MCKERWYGSVGMAGLTLNLSFDMGVVPMDWHGACIYSAPCTTGRVTNVNVATREVLVC